MQAKDPTAWGASLFQLGSHLGFEQVLFGIVPSRTTPFEKAFVRSNYADDWRPRYERNGFAYADPTVSHCLNSSLPLIWEPETFTVSSQPAQYDDARGHGSKSGVTLPLHGPHGEFGVLSFASDARPGAEARRVIAEALPGMTLVRDYALASSSRFRVEAPHGESAQNMPEAPRLSDAQRAAMPRLTRRELEVLQWVMAGKSSWEIARITNCSEATVNFHLANVRQKFDVNTRQQAVVKAIGLGLITPEDHHR